MARTPLPLSGLPRGLLHRLVKVSTCEIPHIFNGTCPDDIEGFDSRDPDCPACRILIKAEPWLPRSAAKSQLR